MPQYTDKIAVVFSGEDKVKLAARFRELAGKGHISEVLMDLIQSWCDWKESTIKKHNGDNGEAHPESKSPYKISLD